MRCVAVGVAVTVFCLRLASANRVSLRNAAESSDEKKYAEMADINMQAGDSSEGDRRRLHGHHRSRRSERRRRQQTSGTGKKAKKSKKGSAWVKAERTSAAANLGKGPAFGHCSARNVDTYKKGDGKKCYIRTYKCASYDLGNPVDQNVGDVAWGVSQACADYGKYLFVFQIEVSQAALDAGMAYSKCNFGEYGSVCGCGMRGTTCGADPNENAASANNFGWRIQPASYYATYMHGGAETCPCYHFSLPSRAQGEIDHDKVAKFVGEQWFEDRSIEAPYQWKFVQLERVVDIEKCIAKHVRLEGNYSTDKIAQRFQKAVFDDQVADCANVTDPHFLAPDQSEDADENGNEMQRVAAQDDQDTAGEVDESIQSVDEELDEELDEVEGGTEEIEDAYDDTTADEGNEPEDDDNDDQQRGTEYDDGSLPPDSRFTFGV